LGFRVWDHKKFSQLLLGGLGRVNHDLWLCFVMNASRTEPVSQLLQRCDVMQPGKLELVQRRSTNFTPQVVTDLSCRTHGLIVLNEGNVTCAILWHFHPEPPQFAPLPNSMNSLKNTWHPMNEPFSFYIQTVNT